MATTASAANAPPGADSGSHRTTEDAAPPNTAQNSMRCPDPSAHQTKNSALQNQASAAALYSTTPHTSKGHEARGVNPLGPDGKLSSASKLEYRKFCIMSDIVQALPPASSTRKLPTCLASPLSELIRRTLPVQLRSWPTRTKKARSGGSPSSRLPQGRLRCWQTAIRWRPCGSQKLVQQGPKQHFLLTGTVAS